MNFKELNELCTLVTGEVLFEGTLYRGCFYRLPTAHENMVIKTHGMKANPNGCEFFVPMGKFVVDLHI